jgi:hypothetical protein
LSAYNRNAGKENAMSLGSKYLMPPGVLCQMYSVYCLNLLFEVNQPAALAVAGYRLPCEEMLQAVSLIVQEL